MGQIRKKSILIYFLLAISVNVFLIGIGIMIVQLGKENDYAAMRLDANEIIVDLTSSKGNITKQIKKRMSEK